MRFNKPAVATGNAVSGGYSGIPSWRRKWIENRVQWVKLDCGCVEDLNVRTLCFINAFDGVEIECNRHDRFAKVVRTLKSRKPPEKLPDTPLF